MGSSVPISKLAEKPPDTPANAAAIPAIGWRPHARNTIAPNGISTTYPTSEATFDMTPRNTNMGVTSFAGVTDTVFFSSADKYPLPSAQPTPSIVTRTTPSGANSVKLVTI